MPWSISKDFTFSASHQLHGLAEGHKCGRVHGHNYSVRVTLASLHLDGHGFILDYGDLAPFGRWLDEHLDHRHLNDVIDGQPSAELLAAHFHAKVCELVPVPAGVAVTVGVSETPKTWAVYEPGT
jgi:6-pyruvoyltetrahydropterin/6-carboxytetrahydropterin synthase